MPLPELESQLRHGTASGDSALFILAQLYGSLARLNSPGGLYRVHGGNSSACSPILALLERRLICHNRWLELLGDHCRRLGLRADVERWKTQSYLYRMQRGTRAIEDLVRPGEHFILLDEDTWDHHHSGRREVVPGRFALPFLEKDGRYWGHPRTSKQAITELERMRGEGIRVIAIAWSGFWWLEFYPEFLAHLRRDYRCLLDADYMLVFELQPTARPLASVTPALPR